MKLWVKCCLWLVVHLLGCTVGVISCLIHKPIAISICCFIGFLSGFIFNQIISGFEDKLEDQNEYVYSLEENILRKEDKIEEAKKIIKFFLKSNTYDEEVIAKYISEAEEFIKE